MEYNTAIGGAEKSQHMEGKASDITIEGIDAKEVNTQVLHLVNWGLLPLIKGIGYYPNSSTPFNHLDIRDGDLVTWIK